MQPKNLFRQLALLYDISRAFWDLASVNDGSDILFGYFHPKRYSGQRVKTPKSIKLSILLIELRLKNFIQKSAQTNSVY